MEPSDSKQLKLLLLLPDGKIHKVQFGSFCRSMREAPLTLTTLAALVPEELDIEIKLIDGSVEQIPLKDKFDIVAISTMTGTANEAYRLAEYFKNQGSYIVLGGVHVTLMPDEAIEYADTILQGSGENTWPQFLKDYSNRKPQKRYKAVFKDCAYENIPVPLRHLQNNIRYNMPNTVSATRGCRNVCRFCSVPSVWKSFKKRPVNEVINELKLIRSKFIAFNDVSMAEDKEYARELFTAMIPLKKLWGGLVTLKAAKDEELVKLMSKSGCRYLLLGFESFSQSSLGEINKGFNKHEEYKSMIEMLHHYKISVQGCFIFGFDHDDKSVFDETIQNIIDLKIDIPRFSILTPYPGTEVFKQMDREKRILTKNWENYDTMHVVYQPAQMGPEELYDGFKYAYRETFKMIPILKRIAAPKFSSLINLVGNVTYKRFVKRLYTSPEYSKPYLEYEA